jgi:hypothetical protein
MNLTILNMGGDHHERGKDVKKMVRKCKEIKTQTNFFWKGMGKL